MNAPLLLQPLPAPEALDRFAAATVGLLGANSAATLPEHLQALAELTSMDLVLLYRGGDGGQGFGLVASFGVPAESVGELGRSVGADAHGGGGALAPPDIGVAPDTVAPVLAGLGIRAHWDEPLWADGDCIGRLVYGSRRWNAFRRETLAVFAATAAQIAVILQRRLSERGDAKAASSPDTLPAAGTEPLLFRRRRDRFIALLAHELRNPVAPIRSGLELLATDRLDAAARHDTVRMMQRQLAQLVHLIDDFLDTARLNTGRLRACREPVHLIAALTSALESIEPTTRAKGQRIERIGWQDAGAFVVDADPVRLTQAFANLLAAAASATPPAGTLTVRLALGADAATLAVEDEGPPIAEGEGREPLDVVAGAAAKDTDQGAGLAWVRGLLALNDGTVVAKNRNDGSGRVFEVTLRVAERSAHAGAAKPARPALGARRILLVDDNHDAAESLGLLFRLDGHTVRLAHDGPGAVTLAAEFEPEVVVMDLGLPGFSGHEAIARIRNASRAARPVIVALTGWGSRADRDASARAGADLHLVKPVAQAELTTAIEALLQPDRPLAAPP